MTKNQKPQIDQMWQKEIEKLLPWLTGTGADIGCGGRTPRPGAIRVDIDPKVKPDFICSGDKLPFENNFLDYITSVHSFEHFSDQKKLLIEWLRVLKSGGIIGIVHPDIQYTKSDKPAEGHQHEKTYEDFIKMIERMTDLPCRLIDHGIACPNWSFYAILQKI